MLIKKLQLRSKWMLGDFLNRLRFPLNLNSAAGKVRVLCLHGVCSDDRSFINGRFMRVSQLEDLVSSLAEKTNILSLEDFLKENIDSNRMNVLLTFDDGYRNNLELALPVLEKFNAPATIFCTHRKMLWADLLDIAIAEKSSLEKVYNHFLETNKMSVKELKEWGVQQSAVVLEVFTSILYESIGSVVQNHYDFFELLNDHDLIKLRGHRLISLGNHGANHISYIHRTTEEIEEDLEICKERLIRVGTPYAEVVAFPYGHYSEKISGVLIESGYHTQFVTEGNPKLRKGVHDRLVVNPFISMRNQLISIRDGKY